MKPLLLTCVALCLGGCNTILRVNGEDAQSIVDKRAVGVSVGDFFDRYGQPRAREESNDGTRHFIWEGGITRAPAGPNGIEESVCRLRVSSDKAGRITEAAIIRDAKGERRLSRCAELFDS